jgi:hypothetical protein
MANKDYFILSFLTNVLLIANELALCYLHAIRLRLHRSCCYKRKLHRSCNRRNSSRGQATFHHDNWRNSSSESTIKLFNFFALNFFKTVTLSGSITRYF